MAQTNENNAVDHDGERVIVSLPFIAAARAASAPALGRFGRLYGSSPLMQEVYRMIERVAPTVATVFVAGESGCGKELVAKSIHERSPRARGPFVAINCGAIPANLIEAELFGHEKGAFTGANRQHRGCFERAEGGTLFLDEITEMAPEMQVRLLRVLETGRFTRVGGDGENRTDVRIIAATNRDAMEAVREGRLREPIGTPLAEMERQAIFATLDHCRGNKRRAAEMLGVSLKTLYNRLTAYQSDGARLSSM
jgi:DNA-binding NtrC family response regulator